MATSSANKNAAPTYIVDAQGNLIESFGGSGLYTAVTNFTGNPTAGAAFTKLLDANANRIGGVFQNTHDTDTLLVIEGPAGNFADAIAAQAAWDAGGGFEVQPKDPYYIDGKGEVWIKRGGAANITIRGHRA